MKHQNNKHKGGKIAKSCKIFVFFSKPDVHIMCAGHKGSSGQTSTILPFLHNSPSFATYRLHVFFSSPMQSFLHRKHFLVVMYPWLCFSHAHKITIFFINFFFIISINQPINFHSNQNIMIYVYSYTFLYKNHSSKHSRNKAKMP